MSKRFICSICIFAVILSCFCACGVKLPDTEATTKVASCEVNKDDIPTTVPAPDVTKKVNGTTKPAETEKYPVPDNYEYEIADYYVYGKSYAKIVNVEMKYYGLGHNIDGTASVELTGLSSRDKEFRIGIIFYDSEGEIVGENLILASKDNAAYKAGATIDCRFTVDRRQNIAKIAFVDYSEVADNIAI